MTSSLLGTVINQITGNNIVLYSLLGICPLILYRLNFKECYSTGLIIVVIMLLSFWMNLFVYHFLLLPLNFTHLRIVLFVLIIYLTIYFAEVAMNKYYPPLAILFKQYPEFFYTNYAIYGAVLLNVSHKLAFFDSTISVLGSGLGYFIVLFIFMEVKERINAIKKISAPRRMFLELSILALMSLVFISVTGLK